MSKKHYGRIVNVSSIAGRNRSIVSGVHYTSSKAALIGLTRQLALEAGPHGITINCTCPSQTYSEMLLSSMSKVDKKNYHQPFRCADFRTQLTKYFLLCFCVHRKRLILMEPLLM